MKTFLQEGDPGLSKQDAIALDAFPSREELARYEVIVLGDIDPQLLGAAAQRDLIEAVNRAGAGLVILPSANEGLARWENQPLEFFLPARASEMTFAPEMEASRSGALSAAGKQTTFCLLGNKVSQADASWKTLPPLMGLLTTARLRPDVRVLVEASDLRMENGRPSPMVTTHYVGSAMVLCHWTDEWWRWAAPSTRGLYDQYWMQAIRALCNQKTTLDDELFELRTDGTRYEEGQSIKLSLQFRDERSAPSEAQGAVISVSGDGASREIVLTREVDRRDLFRGSVANLPPGNYLANVVRPAIGGGREKECAFEVLPRASESARLKPDFDALRKLASQSGGKFYTAATAKRLVDELPRGTAVRTTPLAPRSAWNLPVWAALLVAILSLEWFLRRAGGLL